MPHRHKVPSREFVYNQELATPLKAGMPPGSRSTSRGSA
jgi:hypothetical protein